MKNSGILTLNWKDFGKALVVAFLTTFVASIGQAISDSHIIPTSAELIIALKAGAGAAIAYIIKNLFTNNEDKLLKKDNPVK